MTKQANNDNKFFAELIILCEKLNRVDNIAGSIMLVLYFLIYSVNLIFIKTFIETSLANQESFRKIFILFMLYKPMMLFLIIAKYIIRKIETINYKKYKKFTIQLLDDLLTLSFQPKEFIVVPLKTIVFIIFFLSELRSAYFGSVYVAYASITWIIIDGLLSLVFVEVKVSFLRSYSPNSGYFCKLDSFFEETLHMVLPIIATLNAVNVLYGGANGTIKWICIFIELFLMLVVNVIYLRELPFMSRLAEVLCGNLLFSFSLFFTLYGLTDRDINLSLKLWCFVFPFQVICYRYFLKRAYNVDYMSKSSSTSYKSLKKILVAGHGYGSIEEKLYDSGVIKNFLMSGKVMNKQHMNIWKKMVLLKNRQKPPIYDNYDAETASLHQPATQDEATEHKPHRYDDLDIKDVYNDIDSLILNEFIKNRNRSIYSHMMKILWMLDNRIVLSEILRGLTEMAGKTTSFKSKFMYFYTKNQIEKTLKGYYYHRDLYFHKKNEMRTKKVIKIEHELQKINEIGVDLSYAFFYKEKLKEMVDLIEAFIKLNRKYMSLLRAQSKSLKELNETCLLLYNLKIEIGYAFDRLHSRTRNVEILHLTPYFYFLSKCINLHRSASKVFKEYKQRVINKKNLIDEKSMVINDVNLFHQSVMLMIESQKKGFGTILDVYGNTKYLHISPLELKSKHMDCLIMESHRTAHSSSCRNFNNRTITPLLGDMISTFVKLPDKDYVLKASINIKIIPYAYSDFKFIVGIKFNRLDSRMYILLDKNNNIDSFSYNMKFLFRNSKNFLNKNIALKQMCPDIAETLNERRRLERNENGGMYGDEQENGGEAADEDFLSKSGGGGYYNKSQRLMGSINDFGMSEEEFNMKKEMFGASIRFTHSETGEDQIRNFQVQIYKKRYSYGNFSYTILALTSDDNDQNRNWMTKPANANEGRGGRRGGNEALDINFDDELPNVATDRLNGTNLIRHDDSTYKFMVGSEGGGPPPAGNQIDGESANNDQTNTLVVQKNYLEPIAENQALENQPPSPMHGPTKMAINSPDQQGPGSIWNNQSRGQEMNRLNAGGRSKQQRDFERNKIGEDLDLKVVEPSDDGQPPKEESNISMGYNKSNENIDASAKYHEDDSMTSDMEEDAEEFGNMSDLVMKQRIIEGTGSVFSNANIQTHKKYFAFEDAVTKRAAFFETIAIISLYILSLCATIFFTLYIEVTLNDKNGDFKVGNDMFTAFSEHTFQSQMFYSKILTSMGYVDGVYKKDRYAVFNFSNQQLSKLYPAGQSTDYTALPYQLANIESYQSYQIQQTKDTFINLTNKIYKYMGNFGTKKSLYFDNNITYYQHEVNGSQILKSMTVYQGYLLLMTAKSIEISKIPIKKFGQKSLNREILYMFDNSLNGLPMAYEPFNEMLYTGMNGAYEEFMSFVLICLFIIVGLILILMLITIVFILRIKRMFWDIYQSFINITEGEYDERFKQLTIMNDMLHDFKMHSYFHDFMGFREIERPSTDAKKKAKSYQGRFYCFGLVLSIASIVMFYLVQVSFSSIMMLIFQENVGQALWITDKQWKSKQLISNQMIFYNGLKQKILFDKPTKGLNKSIDVFLTEWNTKMKENSAIIFHLFEESKGTKYEELEKFLKKASNSSLCSFVGKLEKQKELCDLLDNQIPLRGIVQVFFRIVQYLEEIYTRVINSSFDRDKIMNDPEFVGLEYTFENVYFPAFLYLENQIQTKFEKFVSIRVNEAVNLIITMMISFIMVSFFFTLFSFKNIILQVSRVSFSFQLLSTNTIIGNPGIKYRFLKVYRLNQKHF